MRPENTPELIERARQFALEKPSVSYIQRKLGIGYNRACELMEYFEDAGLVSRCDAAGRRTVLTPEKSHFERWCNIIAKTPSGRPIEPVEGAAKDGSNQVFRVVLDLKAFWCDDAKRWVLTRPLNLEYLPTQADHMPAPLSPDLKASQRPTVSSETPSLTPPSVSGQEPETKVTP